MHPLVQQILQQLQQALAQGALPPEALIQLLQGLEGMMQGGQGGMPMGGQPPMPQGQPPMDPQQQAMMQMLQQ